ncbi:hypothetical protein AMECASPLE_035201 [Ameca splendens]|uniref:Uncharacterized protein n=1 Tax=Ameca splendens TaxID=208324 RepID=A0ABV0YJ02_9TELE
MRWDHFSPFIVSLSEDKLDPPASAVSVEAEQISLEAAARKEDEATPAGHEDAPGAEAEPSSEQTSSGLWEKAGVPRENPYIHTESMQTPCRTTPGLGFEPWTPFRQDGHLLCVVVQI